MEKEINLIRSIELGARYFEKHFKLESETNLNSLEYSFEAIKSLIEQYEEDNVESYQELFSKKTFKEFEFYLENSSIIDSIIDIFEAR